MSEQTLVAADPLTGYSEISVWPLLSETELTALKEVLPETVPAGIDAAVIDSLRHGSTIKGSYEGVLIPRESFKEEPEASQRLAWSGAIAAALGYRELRFGKQSRYPRNNSSYFLGFSSELTLAERELCFGRKLRQRCGEADVPAVDCVANDDGTQTFEYRANMTTSVSIRLEMLRNSVLNKLGPGLGRLVTSDVYVELLPDQEQPSLFGDSLNPELHEQAV